MGAPFDSVREMYSCKVSRFTRTLRTWQGDNRLWWCKNWLLFLPSFTARLHRTAFDHNTAHISLEHAGIPGLFCGIAARRPTSMVPLSFQLGDLKIRIVRDSRLIIVFGLKLQGFDCLGPSSRCYVRGNCYSR
jgi:hypothetical protein